MYDNCPLFDSKKKPLKLASIKFEHLYQLRNEQIEEGYTVEYKSVWNKEVREKHLCQTMSSFANSSGGWLFIGISDDGSIKEIEKEKSDYSQQISNILATHVTPIPLFNCRFVKTSASAFTGVLVIHVFEGINPPYVSKGRIYVRNGSSKTPINASRSDIDNLFEKSKWYKTRLIELLESPIGYSVGKAPYGIIAYCNSSSANDRLTLSEIDTIKVKLNESGLCLSSIRTAESIIFLNSDIVKPNSCTSYIELFFDKSIRMIYYFPCHIKEKRDKVKQYLNSKVENIDIGNFVMVDLFTIFMHINTMNKGIILIFKEIRKDIRSYLIQAEFSNTQETFAYFDPIDDFTEYVINNGFNYSLKDKQRTFIIKDIDIVSKNQEGYLQALAYSFFANSLGFSRQKFLDLFIELARKNEASYKPGIQTYSFNYDR
jgi:hypothetical protein